MTVVVRTTDPEEAHETLSRLYKVRNFSVPEGRVSLTIRHDQVGMVGMHELKLGESCSVDGAPLGALYIARVSSGTLTYHRGRSSTTYGADDVFLSAQPHLPYRGDLRATTMEFVVLDPALLAFVADQGAGSSTGPVHLTAYEPYTRQHAQRWLSLYDHMREMLLAPLAEDEPLLTGAAAQLLAAGALSTFPNTAVGPDSRRDRRDAHSETLRRAMVFIDANADRDISVADIAKASYASIRSIQLAFRGHLDTTPHGYLRQVRLDYAHRQLAAADPSQETVRAVARRWGFTNLSRFAASYQATYGVAPSHTLRHTPYG